MKKAVLLTILTLSGFGVFATQSLETKLQGDFSQSQLDHSLFGAVYARDLKHVLRLLKEGANPNAILKWTDSRHIGWSLFISGEWIKVKKIEVPLTALVYIDIDKRWKERSFFDLYSRIIDIDYEIAKALISRGADLNIKPDIISVYNRLFDYKDPSFFIKLLKLVPISFDDFQNVSREAVKYTSYKTLKALMEHNPKFFIQHLESLLLVTKERFFIYSNNTRTYEKMTNYLNKLAVTARELQSKEAASRDISVVNKPCPASFKKN